MLPDIINTFLDFLVTGNSYAPEVETIRFDAGIGTLIQGNELFAGGNYLEIFANGEEGAKPEGAIIHFAIRTNDVDGAIARARAAGRSCCRG